MQNGRGAKWHEAQNGMRHKTAHNPGNAVNNSKKCVHLKREQYNKKSENPVLVHNLIWSAGTVNIISSAWTRKMFPLMEYWLNLLPVKTYGTSHQVLQWRLVHLLL
jgi:hypothetical protein